MGLFVFAVFLGLIGGVLFAIGNREVTDVGYDNNTYRLPFRWIGAFLFIFVAAPLVLLSMAYKVDTGEAVLVKKTGGGVSQVVDNTGYHFKAPWVKTSTWNTRLQRIELSGNGSGVDGEAVSTGFDGGGSGGSVSVSLVYSIPGDNVEKLYNEHRDQDKLEENRLTLALRDTTATEAARFDPFTVRERRTDLQEAIVTALKDELEGEVTVNRVELGNVNLPEQTETALNEVVQRRSQVEKAEADLETARVTAAEAREIAKGQADSAQIARCGGTEKVEEQTINGEKQQVTVIVPNTGANCQDVLSPEVLANNYIQALQAIGTSERGPATIVVPESINALLNLAGQAAQG